jgi:hypothetical protein
VAEEAAVRVVAVTELDFDADPPQPPTTAAARSAAQAARARLTWFMVLSF